ncbi:MAG: RDD family protein [Planctomyces sp.]|nr:RDD family protein [Planctomyces sp.]
MNQQQNPYASPTDPQHASEQLGDRQRVIPAGQGARFANLIIDYFAQMGVGLVLGIVIVVVGGDEGARFLESTSDILIGLPIALSYYFVCEATTSRTLGKLITGTKVVNKDGGPASIGQIAGRTLCRIIPFEAFSFLGTPTRGWHDSIPGTFVVKSK